MKTEMKSTCNLKLIVISSPTPVSNEAENINRLFEAGLKVFHLRKPYSDFVMIANLISQIDSKYHDRIAIHQYHTLAGEFGINRLHFTEMGRNDISVLELLKIKEGGYKISTSLHELSSLTEVSHFDYAFFSPVFDSISKQGYQSSISADFILEKPENAPAVIALGGIHQENIHLVKSMKFDGVAVLGIIWNEEENQRVVVLKNLLKTCEKNNCP
ncbi:thiamine phosphate synthase [Lunatibacter salilacus]|uniref:thiamine phosphate synthase n=1 Tax=Lunatibacter salilacus TaxID=2483804 RepID=UPI0018FE1291|nr:thiamine phosphate synthase [Lunatibacter salilacus]